MTLRNGSEINRGVMAGSVCTGASYQAAVQWDSGAEERVPEKHRAMGDVPRLFFRPYFSWRREAAECGDYLEHVYPDRHGSEY